MTETEKILTQAEDIARRTFEEPTQQTVMQLFARLCDEQDNRAFEALEEACSLH
ncbi:hypothetical protein Q9R35_00790 [Alcaligenes sp. AB3]|uniref:hypothetical protein n=1 Tax=Alcaligenes sp. AB3 TaxID=2962569 RepID=UPI002880FF0A|nr:hypothetical protein [Alcaligenes sp. AB3]MDT0215847.1 hypothetical protein [Alcaligenes sp. AB3]